MTPQNKQDTTMPPKGDEKNDITGSSYFTINRVLLKAKYSFYSAVVFFLFSNPETYRVLQTFFGKFVTFITTGGAPTVSGIFISTFLFFITMLGLMLLPNE